MSRTVGIDLGTTNSVVAVLEGGHPTVIPNAEGSRTTPSVVGFTKDGERLVGILARRQAVLNPKGTVSSIKRFTGRNYDEVGEEMKIVPYTVVKGNNNSVRVEVDGKQYAPEEISAQVLRKLAQDASSWLGEKVTDAVITVPAYFNDAQRQATKNAGKIAGLNVLRVVNEPTAAALAYGMDKKNNETVMVFDLGGGTFDVSILDVGEGLCEVRSTSGDTHLGGDDFDKRVVDWLADEFKNQEGIDLRNDRQPCRGSTRRPKRPSANCQAARAPRSACPSSPPTHGRSTCRPTSPGPSSTNSRGTSSEYPEPMKQVLKDAKLEAGDIDEVIMVGGSTRIPAVQELVKRFTGART